MSILSRHGITGLLIGVLAAPLWAFGQVPLPLPYTAGQAGAPVFNQQELDQMLAPVALYPDALLAQVLMAATYPQEVVDAARWMQQNPGLTGAALQTALQGQPWDASVKSLCAFPAVLDRMSRSLDWTQRLGDAFLDQQPQVMDRVQALRRQAQAAGNLQSNSQETVGYSNNAITIAPANPQIVYVPTYDPQFAYGSWSWPAYPPYYPSYWAAGLGAGIFAGAWLWGDFDWRRHEVHVDRDRFNEFNHSHIVDNRWHHDEMHRGEIPYRGERFGGPDNRFGAARGGSMREGGAFHGGGEMGGHEGGGGHGGGGGHH
jgi:uncharacterized membrane protein YgcG